MPIGGLAADDPRRVGGYRLTGVLGRGGQASVYLGMGGDGRLVAVKVFGAEWLSREPESHDQIAAEVAALQAVPAFGIARLIAADPAANPPYLVSEYVPGATLAERVAAEGPLDPWAVERLALATLAALGAVHRVDLVHRDIKPGNIVLGPDGPRLIDFGIVERRGSREDVSDGVLGTRAFLAPELLDGVPADASGDMYAWAATIAYAATGRVPAGSDDALLGVPPGLADLVRRCLSHRAAERPTAAQALGHVLSAAAPSPLAAPATPAWGTPDGRAGTAPAPGVSRGAPPPASPPAAGPWRRQRHLSPPAPPRFLVLIQATRQRVRVARPRMQRQRVQRWEALLIVGATLVIPIVFGVEAWRSRPGVTSSRVAEFPAPTPTPSPTEPTEEAPEPEVSYPPLSPVKPRTDALQGTQIPVRTDGPGWAMPPVPSDDGSRIHLVERCRLSAWTTTRPTRIGTPTVLPARGTRCPSAISGDGRFLVTSGTGHLSMTDRRRARTTRLPAPDGLPVEIQIAADGRHLVGLVDRSTVASWDLEHPEKPPAAAGPPPPAAMWQFSASGRVGAVMNADDDLEVWDLAAETQLSVIGPFIGVSPFALSPDGTLVAATTDYDTGEVVVFTTGFGPQEIRLRARGRIDAITYSVDGQYLATVGSEGAQLWETATGNPVGPRLTLPSGMTTGVASGRTPLSGARFSRNRSVLVAWSDAGQVVVWPTTDLRATDLGATR